MGDMGNDLAIIGVSTYIVEMTKGRNRLFRFYIIDYINKLIQTFVNPLALMLLGRTDFLSKLDCFNGIYETIHLTC